MRYLSAQILGTLCALLLDVSPSDAEFVQATHRAGVFYALPTWGAQAIDIDDDGDIDLLRAHHQYGATVHTNTGAGYFSLWGLPQLVNDKKDRHGYLWADLDNDGVKDVLCSKGGSGGSGIEDNGNDLWRGTVARVFLPVQGSGGMADMPGRGRAFSAADIDLDGDLDVFHAKAPLAASPNSMYRNDGSLNFVDIAPALGLDENLGTVGGLFADYDDDGDPDLLVGGEEFHRPTMLYRNDSSEFVDVTDQAFAWLPVVAGADWGDYDNDGDLDLAVTPGTEGVEDSWDVEDGNTFWFFVHHRLGENGSDTFHFEATGGDPIVDLRVTGEFDAEAVFLGPDAVHPGQHGGEGNELWIDENRKFLLTNAYVGAPEFTPGEDYGVYIWRLSENGAWMVCVSAPPGTYGNVSARIEAPGSIVNVGASDLEIQPITPYKVRVYRNLGDGTFRDETENLGFTPSLNPRGVQWVDFDNDGDLDLHQMNKGTVQAGNESDILWRNDGGAFSFLAAAGWVPGFRRYFTDGGVWADFDRDGDLDLMMQEGAPPLFVSLGTLPLYYENEGPTGNWLSLNIRSALNGATPVGTKVTAFAGDLRVHRRVEANSWRGFQEPFILHFGLGAHAAVDSLVVEWPNGLIDKLGPLPVNTAIQYSQWNATDAPGPGLATPAAFAGPVFPQPSRGAQRIRLYNPQDSRVDVSVYDIMGRRIRVLAAGRQSAGETSLEWDGRDEAGRSVPAGVYFIRGQGDLSFQRKAVRLR